MIDPALTPVSLQEMLARRDARAAAQQQLLTQHGRPLLQLTLVTPGPLKNTAQTRAVFALGLAAIDELLAATGLPVLAKQLSQEPTGPEALWVVDGDAHPLKQQLMALEDSHPLGRLWDADALGPDGLSRTRGELGLPPRRCLLCNEAAHACARSAAHTLADLQQAVDQRWRAYAGAAAA